MKWRFIITGRCNLKCYFCMKEYCPSAYSDTILRDYHYKKLITADETDNTKTQITITGGEPLLCNNFSKITKLCANNNTHLTLVTNGTLLSNKLTSLVPLSEIHVSIHSLAFEEWHRITLGSMDQFNMLLKGVRETREKYYKLPIRLNVVGTELNGVKESIEEYLKFAKENELSICVFREGYLDWAKKNNINANEVITKHKIWDLDILGATLVDSGANQKVYKLKGVEIILRETSTHIPVWDTIWVDPNGFAYADIMLSGDRIQLALEDDGLLYEQIHELKEQAKRLGNNANDDE